MIFLLGICFWITVCMGDHGPKIIQNNFIEFTMTNGAKDKVGSRAPRQASPFPRRETKPQVVEFSVKSTIISRYAFTAVSCTMVNRAAEAKDAVFQMLIPAAAFVSNFTMIIGGRTYQSHVTWNKEKNEKDDLRNTSTFGNEENGVTEMETFKASAVIPGRNKAVFLLMYEELLQRRLGMYEHMISVRPQQLVGQLKIEVNIFENSGITQIEVPPFQNNKQSNKNVDTVSPPPSTVINQTEKFARISFNPSVILQAKMTQKGIFGDFAVRYDVKRELSIGEIQVLNGYFVHYFAPTDLPPLPKNVVFVIDTSASMVGTKMRQTKEALFTILQDLRPDDYFNIIGFSSRIKVWQPDNMVKVTPNNIRDAKKFIYGLSPTGGTDVNGGIQTGANLLNKYLSKNGWHERSVSLIIFLTDGRPTIGEIQSANILGNTKNVIKEKFCLFSIGIGNDVDYNLLEKISLENCGMMRRIKEDEDAGAQLKGFYDEIGTPLLSDIHITYPPDSVEYVTQNMFFNYFNGSELVVAGKLVNTSSNTLHVEIKASNRNKYVVLETDVKIEDKEQNVTGSEVFGENPEYRNHLERLWGYLTFKELLTSWHKTDSTRKKTDVVDKAIKLALLYNFVTPFTLLEVKDPGFQADPPKEEATSFSTEGIGQKLLNLQGKKSSSDSPPKRQGKQRTSDSKTSADGDPHFVVDFPLSKLTICFNIDGEPGDILRLVSDHKNSGVTVNGQLIGAPAPPNGHKKQRTYFSKITIIINKPKRSYIEITPTKVILDSKDRLILSCDKTAAVQSDDLVVSIAAKSNVTVTIQGTISFVILVHQYKNPAPFQRNHLGFYISNSKGLSLNSHGLLGQFLYNNVKVTQMPLDSDLKKANQTSFSKPVLDQNATNMLTVRNRKIPVIRKQRKLYNGLHQVDCWFAKNNAAKLIDGTYQDYLVPHPFDYGSDLITNEV